MTEQPDTAALMEDWHRDADHGRDWHHAARELMVALDAARAERDALNVDAKAWMNNCGRARARTEAAEERVAVLERLMEQEDHEWLRERAEVYDSVEQAVANMHDMEANWLSEKVLRQMAEARIAAALAIGDPIPADIERPASTPPYVRGYQRCFVDVRRALTEVTND